MRVRVARHAFLAVGLGLSVGSLAFACSPVVEPARSEAAPAPPARGSSAAPTAWSTAAQLEAARTFRVSTGLRADMEWIRSVATGADVDERASAYGIPLSRDEIRELQRRARTTDAITSVIQARGRAYPEAWAGVYVDDGVVVGRFTGDLGPHEDALQAALAPRAPWRLEAANWTLEHLQVLRDRIAHDGWLTSEGYDLLDLGADVRANAVQLHVSSARPDAAERIARHYGAGDQLVVTSDGTGVTALPTGNLQGVVVDTLGRPIVGLDVEVVADIPGAGPRGDRGIETGDDGRFSVEGLTATGYALRLLDPVADDGTLLEGSARRLVRDVRVEIAAAATTFVRIIVAIE